jgi:uroporphyrinogen-III synthase
MKAPDDDPAVFMMRALITRPRAEAEALAKPLAERGVDAVVEPLIEIVERGAALPDLAGIQAILCTSANGARALARAHGERRVPIFAVGDSTARAAWAAGFREVDCAGGDVEDLARLVRRRLRPADGKLLHAAGSEIAGDLAAALGAAGFEVERAMLYEARAVDSLTASTASLIESGAIDLALFFSPRTAAIFARLAAAAGIAGGLAATAAISISRAADAALGDLPFRDRAVAAEPTQAALLALVDHVAGQPA